MLNEKISRKLHVASLFITVKSRKRFFFNSKNDNKMRFNKSVNNNNKMKFDKNVSVLSEGDIINYYID